MDNTPEAIHDISGFLPHLHIFGQDIPTYFFVISLSFCLCIFWFLKRAARQGLDHEQALDVTLVLMTSGFVGARLFHIFYEQPAYYAEDLKRILYFWHGGFVFYGGALLSAACCYLWLKRRRQDVGKWFDVFAPVGALGYALGRMACLMTGCCYGSVCKLEGFSFRHPTQLYAVAWEVLVLFLLLSLERKRPRFLRLTWSLFFTWMFLHGLGRLIMEFFRDDDRGPALFGLSIATYISLGLMLGAAQFFVRKRT